MSTPKVLIGAPTHISKSYCVREFAEACMNICYDNKEFAFIDNTNETDELTKRMNNLGLRTIYKPMPNVWVNERMATGCNMLVSYAIKHKFTHYLSLETDILPQPDVLVRLLACKKPVIAMTYQIGFGANREAMIRCMQGTREIYETRYKPIELMEKPYDRVFNGGLGCTLIEMPVFNYVKKFRIATKEDTDLSINDHPDSVFAMDCKHANIPVYVYTEDMCTHLNIGDWGLKNFN